MPKAITPYAPRIMKGESVDAQFLPAGSVNLKRMKPRTRRPIPTPMVFFPLEENVSHPPSAAIEGTWIWTSSCRCFLCFLLIRPDYSLINAIRTMRLSRLPSRNDQGL